MSNEHQIAINKHGTSKGCTKPKRTPNKEHRVRNVEGRPKPKRAPFKSLLMIGKSLLTEIEQTRVTAAREHLTRNTEQGTLSEERRVGTLNKGIPKDARA